jgi:hypothetical protein
VPEDPVERQLIEDYIAEHGVTLLPTAYGCRVQYALPEAEQDRRLAELKPDRGKISKYLLPRPFQPTR